MLRNYIKIAARNLHRNKAFSLISILGLAVGLCVTILLVLYIRFELSFDKHYENYDKIYRIISSSKNTNGKETNTPFTLYQIANELKANIPEVKNSTRTWLRSQQEIKTNNESKGYHTTYFADSCFFDVYSMKSIYGNNLHKALTEPYVIVLTESLANKLFGNVNPIGKVVQVLGTDMLVKDVIYDIPENSHLKFDFLISMYSNLEKMYRGQGNSFSTYVLFEEKLSQEVSRKTVQLISDYVNKKYEKYGIKYSHSLQPIEDVYLNSDYVDNTVIMGDKQNIHVFGILCFFILFIAIQNYINLYTAKSEARLKEVGIRKVVGASKKSIIRQFIGESMIVSLLSFLLAMFLVETFLYDFGNLMNSHIRFNYSENALWLFLFFAIAILVGLLSGIFPALYATKFNLINILKGRTRTKRKNLKSTVSLVIIQFTISIVVITLLFGLFMQVRYMKNKDLGFDQNQVVVLQALSRLIKIDYEAIKKELLRNPDIMHVTSSQSIPGKERIKTNIRLADWPAEETIAVSENRVRNDYIQTYGFELVTGNFFSGHSDNDRVGYIVNETTVELLNLQNPINEKIVVGKTEGYIKGVVKDYHIHSLHQAIDPVIISNKAKWIDHLSIKIQKEKVHETMDYIQTVLKNFDSDYTPNFIFMNDFFESMYAKEERITTLILYASILIIILSLLGLLALSSFAVSRRTKEIGIRKVVGSNLSLILLLINKDILKWGVISACIAMPLSYVLLNEWLQDFAFKVNVQAWFFIVSLIIVFGLAILTITIQSFKTANKNPTESLRYE